MSVSSFSLSASPPPQLPDGEKAGGDDPRSVESVFAGQEVAGDLVADELVVRQVAVEGVDHPVAVAPGVGAVHLRAGGEDTRVERVGVAGEVEPVAAPALAVSRRRQQAIHDLGEGVRRLVFEEGVHLFRRRRQAGQIERGPAKQGALVGGLGRLESLGLQCRQDIAIKVGARPGGVLDGRRRRRPGPAETPRIAAVRR